jgi:hypothetical protein
VGGDGVDVEEDAGTAGAGSLIMFIPLLPSAGEVLSACEAERFERATTAFDRAVSNLSVSPSAIHLS